MDRVLMLDTRYSNLFLNACNKYMLSRQSQHQWDKHAGYTYYPDRALLSSLCVYLNTAIAEGEAILHLNEEVARLIYAALEAYRYGATLDCNKLIDEAQSALHYLFLVSEGTATLIARLDSLTQENVG